MSAGAVSAGPAGVKNLRAMFENKSNDQSTSPPSRGRSPNGSVSSQPSRQVSKVRTSFVAVERPSDSAQSPQWALRKTSDVSSMAEVREEAIMEDKKGAVAGSLAQDNPTSTVEGTNLGAILKGSPFETQPLTPTEPPQKSTFPEKPRTNGVSDADKATPVTGKMQSTEHPASNTELVADTKSTRLVPGALNTRTTTPKAKDTPTSARKSPVLQKKDSPTTVNNTGATFKPRGGVNKITGIIQSSNRAREERAKAEQAECADLAEDEPKTNGNGPTFNPRGGVNKITGVIQSSNKAKEERAKAEQADSNDRPGNKQPSVNGGGPVFKPRGGVNKITGIIQSSNRAKEERAKAEQAESADASEGKKTSPKEIKPPSVASKPTAASRAHAQKQDKSSAAEQIKSPTTTRPAKLPSAATAGTAASAARKGVNTNDEESKTTTSERRTTLPQAPRVANTSTRASLAKKSSRASLANGEDQPRSRVSAAHKPADESFLARMTRPTASSARRAQENTQVGSPPRARQTSANHEAVKKPSRKSLSTSSKPLPNTDEANETLLEPVNEGTAAIMIGAEHDEGEPGPAEEEGEELATQQPQPAEVE